ncbi:TonB-dependent receptor [Oleiagrimonas sp. C23AA]|nr:TonB-dependent receptor [Oleiagrimonas sp. C23AA]
MGFAGLAFGQATTGSLFGQAPAGDTVTVVNSSGLTRTMSVDASGRFSSSSLPVGTYTVTLKDASGNVVDTRKNVTVHVGTGTQLSLGGNAASEANAQSVAGLTVTASALPSIDVTSTNVSTVVTSQELAKLPLARSAEAAALLAPGAVEGSAYFTGPLGNQLVSFGGSSVTENAYYINGFNTTDPLSGFGGIALPYGSIDQEEVLTGGYDAKYGRSDGGVLNMIGKRGTNEWHFGAQVLWTPTFGRADKNDYYYPQNTSSSAGQIYNANTKDKSWNTTEDVYVGGPLIKDRLFFFVSAEQSKTKGRLTGSVNSPYTTFYTYKDPKAYVKLDWNINDNNILEYTHVTNKDQYEGSIYNYDYDARQTTDFNSYDTSTKTSARDDILKYTGYLTDSLTVSALYGKQKIDYYNNTPGYDPTYAYIYQADQQNPDIAGAPGITSPNAIATLDDPTHHATSENLRLDVSYVLGDHTISAGIDNLKTHDVNDGTSTSGPGYAWEYNTVNPGKPISDQPFVDAPGGYPGGVGADGQGYYVAKYIYSTSASVRVKQRAQYLQDNWQVNDRLLVKIGVRNDQFTNYNPDGKPFLKLTSPQWSPRLGFSWDVNGDSSFKVFGNLGRYYLAMPASVALRSAGGSLYTRTYYTYTGIDSNGVPTGLTPINTVNGAGQPVSANAEYGQAPDPKTVASKNIKAEHQDELMLGFDKKLNANWVYGANLTYRKLRTGLDDICDGGGILDAAAAQGINIDASSVHGCYLSNPGETNTYNIANGNGGYTAVKVTPSYFENMIKMKRTYTSVNLHLEHPFDGKWDFRVDYTWSMSRGNTEGQVRSDIGQDNVGATVDWDYGYFSHYSNGYLANDRRHQLKARGTYQINPEWMVGALLMVNSGMPKSCLGYYGPYQTNPTGYGAYYHFCDGKPSKPGAAGRNPWTEQLNLNVSYRPAFADNKLAFQMYVYNVLDQQRTLQTRPRYGRAGSVISDYGTTVSAEAPRYVKFGITYDF